MNFWSFGSTAAMLLILLFGPLPLALCSIIPLRRNSSTGTTSMMVLIVGLSWVALQIVSATVLAILKLFIGPVMFVSHGLLLLIGIWYLRKFNHRCLPIITPGALPVNSWLLFLTLTAIAILLLGNLLLQPVTDYDSLYYHLPFMGNLHATGQLTPNSVAPAVAWYPYGWEILCALFLLPIDSDLFVTVPNLLIWGLWGVAVYVVARRLGASSVAAITAVMLLLTQPLVLEQLNSLRVDLPLATFFFTGIALLVSNSPFERPKDSVDLTVHARNTEFQSGQAYIWLLTLLAIVLLPAIKMSGLIYSALLFCLLLFSIWSTMHFRGAYHSGEIAPDVLADHSLQFPKNGTHPPFRSQLTAHPQSLLMLITIAAFVVTVFWYLRNWFLYANPLGIIEIQLGSWVLFPGFTTQAAIRQTTLATLFEFTDPNHWQLYVAQIWHRGHWPLLGLLLFAGLAFFSGTEDLCRKPSPPYLFIKIGLSLPFCCSLCYCFSTYWFTPYSGDDGSFGYQLYGPWVGQAMRFALPALGMVGSPWPPIGASHMLVSNVIPHARRIVVGVAPILVLITLAQRSPIYLAATITMVLFVVDLWPIAFLVFRLDHENIIQVRRFGLSRSQVMLFMLLGFLLFWASMPVLQRVRSERRVQAYGPLPNLIDELVCAGRSRGQLV